EREQPVGIARPAWIVGDDGFCQAVDTANRTGRAKNDQRVLPAATEAVAILRNQHLVETGLAPVCVFACKNLGGRIGQECPQFAHRSPNSRAMMPRRISRVPPRREKEVEDCTRYCIVSSKEASALAGASAWIWRGRSCSSVVPRSFTMVASAIGS